MSYAGNEYEFNSPCEYEIIWIHPQNCKPSRRRNFLFFALLIYIIFKRIVDVIPSLHGSSLGLFRDHTEVRKEVWRPGLNVRCEIRIQVGLAGGTPKVCWALHQRLVSLSVG